MREENIFFVINFLEECEYGCWKLVIDLLEDWKLTVKTIENLVSILDRCLPHEKDPDVVFRLQKAINKFKVVLLLPQEELRREINDLQRMLSFYYD